MIALTEPSPLIGSPRPRISPPVPARSDIDGFREAAAGIGITLMPWQDYAGKFITAIGPDDRLLFREVCCVVARQNGKTTLTKPLIVRALRAGKRILHISATRELPRHMFDMVADALSKEPELFPKRRGRTIWPRYGAGQEEIRLENGGWYRIAAANATSGRGWSTDVVIVDELRAMDDTQAMDAVEPTLTMSADPQIIYLSNAGDDSSVVLNAIRARAGDDANLAYLEWSAAPERTADDPQGWAEANPALGHYPSVLRTLEAAHQKHRLGGTMASFETEHLCRWVPSMRELLLPTAQWTLLRDDHLERAKRAVMGVSLDPDRKRASAVIAWQRNDGTIGVRGVREAEGPVDADAFGEELRKDIVRLGVTRVAYDPLTDAELGKFFKKPEPVNGQKFAAASSQFVNLVAGDRLRWTDADAVTDDLTWTARKSVGTTGAYEAVRAQDDRPITAALAAIRAVGWLASGPRPATPRIY